MLVLRKISLIVPLLALLGSPIIQTVSAEQECERLKHTVEYTQEDAPRGFGKIIKAVTDELNKVLDGVIGAEIEWNGSDLHGQVGERLINTKVQRLARLIPPEILQGRDVFVNEQGQEVISQCFQLPFTIYDTNECTLPQGHEMRHQCQEPSICVNTLGSYECLCARLDGAMPQNVLVQEDSRSHTYSIDVAAVGEQETAFFAGLAQEQRTPWELAMSTPSTTACSSASSTRGCCPAVAHSRDGQDCRKQFQCPIDPCSESYVSAASGNHSCAHNAQCVRRETPQENPNHSCVCPDGFLGNGRTCRLNDAKPEPKVTFGGAPTEETIRSDYCGCTKPTVDACAGFPPCTSKHEVCVVDMNDRPACGCKKGFVKHDQYGCVDERPPQLKLNEDPYNDRTLRLKQGDIYEEHGVRILDGNVEDYLRLLKIIYSEPLHGCLTKVGEFHVNYTISTPWTDPSTVSIVRRVIIEDIDECSLNIAKYESACPELIPRCDTESGAKCVNTVGSYTCECPKFTSGDGFREDYAFTDAFKPEGYKGGTSCVDTTKPVIQLKGPSPKIFKICPCGGVSGIMQDKSNGDDELREAQREHYEHDIKELIKSTQGAELCAHPGNTRPRPTNCVKAYDETHKGDVDLSSRVQVGEPVRKSSLHWVVPYDVKDDAGNEATTIWRDVLVEEVDFEAMESKIREEVKAAKETEIKNAVAKAVQEERKKHNNKGRFGAATQECPACPKCGDSPAKRYDSSKGKVDMAECEKFCEHRAQQCSLRQESYAVAIMVWLEQFCPSWVALLAIGTAFVFGGFGALSIISRVLFNPSSFAGNYDYLSDQEREQSLQNAVTYYPGGSPQPQQLQLQQQGHQQSPHQPQLFGGSMNKNSGGAPVGLMGGPPRASMSMNNQGNDFFLSPRNSPGTGLFSPQSTNGNGMQSNGTMNGSNVMDDPNNIYASPPLTHPSPRHNGNELRRRSPAGYSPGGF